MQWLHVPLYLLVVDVLLVLLKPSFAHKVPWCARIRVSALFVLPFQLDELPALFYQIVYFSFHLKFLILIRTLIATIIVYIFYIG